MRTRPNKRITHATFIHRNTHWLAQQDQIPVYKVRLGSINIFHMHAAHTHTHARTCVYALLVQFQPKKRFRRKIVVDLITYHQLPTTTTTRAKILNQKKKKIPPFAAIHRYTRKYYKFVAPRRCHRACALCALCVRSGHHRYFRMNICFVQQCCRPAAAAQHCHRHTVRCCCSTPRNARHGQAMASEGEADYNQRFEFQLIRTC